SSRRRHTSFSRDWSSDVCSSDLESITLTVGTAIEPARLVERCMQQGFERVEFVEQPGELAVRGGIIDVYPYTGSYPVRIEFFGEIGRASCRVREQIAAGAVARAG